MAVTQQQLREEDNKASALQLRADAFLLMAKADITENLQEKDNAIKASEHYQLYIEQSLKVQRLLREYKNRGY